MDAYEYTFVRRTILKLTGVDLDCYKSAQMQRRLEAFLHRSGFPSWSAMAADFALSSHMMAALSAVLASLPMVKTPC